MDSLQININKILSNISLFEKNNKKKQIIAISGPPGAGKSYLSNIILKKYNDNLIEKKKHAVIFPMDGYHLDNKELIDTGLFDRKGSEPSFNSEKFARDLYKVSQNKDIKIPGFDRELDKTIADQISITSETPLVIVEGNYLLIDKSPWSSCSDLYDLKIFINPGIDVLRERLIQRWLDFGFDIQQAHKKANENDLINAEFVIQNSSKNDIEIN